MRSEPPPLSRGLKRHHRIHSRLQTARYNAAQRRYDDLPDLQKLRQTKIRRATFCPAFAIYFLFPHLEYRQNTGKNNIVQSKNFQTYGHARTRLTRQQTITFRQVVKRASRHMYGTLGPERILPDFISSTIKNRPARAEKVLFTRKSAYFIIPRRVGKYFLVWITRNFI